MADQNSIPNDDDIAALIRSLSQHDHLLEKPPLAVWSGIAHGIASPANAAEPAAESAALMPTPRWGRRHRLIGAAAVLLALTATAGVVALRSASTTVTTIAVARLSSDGLPGAPTGRTGSASVIRHNGREFLRINDDKIAPRSGEYLELWLIDTKVEGMVSLGIVDGNGEFELPRGLRYTDFPIVDISTEPYDGKPTHSGASLLRGSLA